MNETRILAEFLADVSYDKLPKKVIDDAKKCILDHIGGAVFASQTDLGTVMSKVGKTVTGGKCTIMPGTEHVYSAEMAALVNGTFGHGFELDDQNPQSTTHPGCVVNAAAIAMGEEVGADGRKLIEAAVCGYEIMSRCIRPFGHHHLDKGFHPTGSAGAFAGAAAAGKILGFNADQFESALGIAGTYAAGSRQSALKGAMSKRLHGGKGASQGVLIAKLVAAGMDGPSEAFEGKYGFNRLYADSDYPVDFPALVEGLGEHYAIEDTQAKPYSGCGINNVVVDILEKLEKDNPDVFTKDFDAYDHIIVRSHHDMKDCHFELHPKTVMGGQYSAPFVLGVHMEGNIRDPRPFMNDAIVNDPKIMRWADIMSCEIDPEIDAAFPARFGGELELFYKNGKTLKCRLPYPKGAKEQPFTYEEIEQKYRALVKGIIPDNIVESISAKVKNLDSLNNISNLFE